MAEKCCNGKNAIYTGTVHIELIINNHSPVYTYSTVQTDNCATVKVINVYTICI
jgi:hypothetical protein